MAPPRIFLRQVVASSSRRTLPTAPGARCFSSAPLRASEKRTWPKPPPPLPNYPLPDPSGKDPRVHLIDAFDHTLKILQRHGPLTKHSLWEEHLPLVLPTRRDVPNPPPVFGWSREGDLKGAQPKVLTLSTLKKHILKRMIGQRKLLTLTAARVKRGWESRQARLKESQAMRKVPGLNEAELGIIMGRVEQIPDSTFMYVLAEWWRDFVGNVGEIDPEERYAGPLEPARPLRRPTRRTGGSRKSPEYEARKAAQVSWQGRGSASSKRASRE